MKDAQTTDSCTMAIMPITNCSILGSCYICRYSAKRFTKCRTVAARAGPSLQRSSGYELHAHVLRLRLETIAPLFTIRAFRHVSRPVEINPWLDGTGRGRFPTPCGRSSVPLTLRVHRKSRSRRRLCAIGESGNDQRPTAHDHPW